MEAIYYIIITVLTLVILFINNFIRKDYSSDSYQLINIIGFTYYITTTTIHLLFKFGVIGK